MKDNCNNDIIDKIIGIDSPTYDTVGIAAHAKQYPTSLIQKNKYNSQNLRYGVNIIQGIMHDTPTTQGGKQIPTMEAFTNDITTPDTDTDIEENACKYKIENKCYDQYVNADEIYYDTGAGIFESVFPSTDKNVFSKQCHTVTKWISENMTYLLLWKCATGLCAFALYYSMDAHGDYRIKVFKGFIALMFSELYLMYCIYKLLIKPHFPTLTTKPVFAR
jgi:hypothetical protein